MLDEGFYITCYLHLKRPLHFTRPIKNRKDNTIDCVQMEEKCNE